MYASNEDEDWVYLNHNTTLNNEIPSESMNDLCSSSSSSSSNSTKSNRSESLSSIEFDQPILSATTHDTDTSMNEFHLTEPSTLIRKHSSATELSSRRRTISHPQQTDLYPCKITRSTSILSNINLIKRDRHYQNKDETLIAYIFMIILFILPFFLGHLVSRWDQPAIHKIVEELDRVNQRLNEIPSPSLTTIEETLTVQLEKKLQQMIHQQINTHYQDVDTLSLQVKELQQELRRTQENLTTTINRLSLENNRLEEELKSYQNHFKNTEESVIDTEPIDTNTEDIHCEDPPTSSLHLLLTFLIKQTISVAEDLSIHLSNVFEHCSASVSDATEKSHRRFMDFTSSSDTEQVHRNLLRSFTGVFSSIHRTTLNCIKWVKSHDDDGKFRKFQEPNSGRKFPWRWSLSNNYERQRTRHRALNDERFPFKQIRSIQNWVVKIFRP